MAGLAVSGGRSRRGRGMKGKPQRQAHLVRLCRNASPSDSLLFPFSKDVSTQNQFFTVGYSVRAWGPSMSRKTEASKTPNSPVRTSVSISI